MHYPHGHQIFSISYFSSQKRYIGSEYFILHVTFPQTTEQVDKHESHPRRVSDAKVMVIIPLWADPRFFPGTKKNTLNNDLNGIPKIRWRDRVSSGRHQ